MVFGYTDMVLSYTDDDMALLEDKKDMEPYASSQFTAN